MAPGIFGLHWEEEEHYGRLGHHTPPPGAILRGGMADEWTT